MTKGNRVVEWIKTVLIVLLSVSALMLAWRTDLFSGIIDNLPFFGSVADLVRGSAGTTETGGVDIKEAARPLCIVITNENGDHYGVKYDTDTRNAVYDRTSSIIGEALGSASMPKVVDESEWREALSGTGIYFEYLYPVKLSVLDGWLGAPMPETAEDVPIRRVCVAFGEDKSRVYYQDIERGLFIGADTASASGKIQELEIYSENGAVLAFEMGIPSFKNAPYMLIMQESEHPVVSAVTAGSGEELLEITIEAMGQSEETYTKYYDNRGVLVCVGTQFNSRVDANGRVFFRWIDEPEQNQNKTRNKTQGETQDEYQSKNQDNEKQIPDVSKMIEGARAIVSDTIVKTCGDAEVFFETAKYEPDGSYSVYFGYYIAGGRIFLHNDDYAARIRFSSGAVSDIELNYRSFLLTSEFTKLFSEKYALAAAGGEFILSYSDSGPETLEPSWVKY